MSTVDLPAHNVYPMAGSPSPTIIGGPECLATTDPATGVILSAQSQGFFVGAVDTSGGSTALGFGLWEQPDNTVVTDVRFVALAYHEGGAPVPPGEPAFPDGWFVPYPQDYPFLVVEYDGSTPHGGWNISNIPLDAYGEADTRSPINHLIGGDDYVIAGIGSPDTGTFGLCPQVWVDFSYPDPAPDIPVHLAYLAIRITYDFLGGRMPPLRQVQRGDGLGSSVPRAVQNNSRQASLRSGRAFI